MSDINEAVLTSPNVIVRTAVPRRGRLSIAFDAERLALIPFRKPAATILIAVALTALAFLGIQRIRIDDSLTQLFHSNSPAFRLFEQVSHDFPSSEYDAMIVVISFSDSMQLTFAARDQLMAGRDKRTAFRNAIFIVGPACVLTHAAAGLSLLGLLASSSDLIRGFGEAGFLATAIALVTVLSLVPAFGVLLIRNEARFVATLNVADPGVTGLRRFCAWIAEWMVSHAGAFSLVGLIAVGSLGVFYRGLEPSYRLADQVPDKEQAVAASGRLDAEITGSRRGGVEG